MALPARIPRTVHRPPPRVRGGDSRKHLAWLRTLSCVVCGKPAEEAHHLLGSVDGLPKSLSTKNEDRWAVPVTRDCHRAAHAAGDDETWFTSKGIDARSLASALWRVSGDTDAGERIVYRARVR